MITIYTITYNEEFIIPYFIKWYRDIFVDCKIIIYDNESSDKTKQIALSNKCEVISYSTNNELSDRKYIEIKNNCWKSADTKWVIVCDSDEFLNLKPEDLKGNHTIFKSKGYNVCNIENLSNILDIKHGIEDDLYNKSICFNKEEIVEINYDVGCHSCIPEGNVIYSEKNPKLLHMKFLNEDYLVNKYKNYKNRMSKENIENKWGAQYMEEEEEKIRMEFKNNLKLAKTI